MKRSTGRIYSYLNLACATALVDALILLYLPGKAMIRIRTVVITCATALFASLLLARVHPFGDAGLHAPFTSPIPEHSSIPPQIRETLAKCVDCHSTQTRAPFYSRLAPFSWLMERDIIEGRDHLYLSSWDTYSLSQQQVLQSKIIQQVKSGKMPLPQYRLIHWSSSITPADIKILTAWAHQDSGSATPVSTPVTAGSAAHGKLVFEKRCTGCHSLEQNREGPNLRGVFGRASGSAPNFNYSAALRNAHITWNDQNLDRWLTDPDAFLPGNDMDFHVANPQERQDLIRFLKEQGSRLTQN